jgi:5'-3' exonuclease
VAPRAKMNQQRSRRYLAVREAQFDKEKMEKKIAKQLLSNPNNNNNTPQLTMEIPTEKDSIMANFDSNLISPGLISNLLPILNVYRNSIYAIDRASNV